MHCVKQENSRGITKYLIDIGFLLEVGASVCFPFTQVYMI